MSCYLFLHTETLDIQKCLYEKSLSLHVLRTYTYYISNIELDFCNVGNCKVPHVRTCTYTREKRSTFTYT